MSNKNYPGNESFTITLTDLNVTSSLHSYLLQLANINILLRVRN